MSEEDNENILEKRNLHEKPALDYKHQEHRD